MWVKPISKSVSMSFSTDNTNSPSHLLSLLSSTMDVADICYLQSYFNLSFSLIAIVVVLIMVVVQVHCRRWKSKSSPHISMVFITKLLMCACTWWIILWWITFCPIWFNHWGRQQGCFWMWRHCLVLSTFFNSEATAAAGQQKITTRILPMSRGHGYSQVDSQ